MRGLRWKLAVFASLLGGGVAALAKDAGAPEPEPAPTVTIVVRTRPAVKARVFHGKKLLGRAPVKVVRKRDSGPLDLVLRASGFVPVATRAYTFRDDVVTVPMTRVEDRSTIYGYKAPLDAAPVPADGGTRDGGGKPDAGASPPAPQPPPSPSPPPPPP